LKVLARHCGYVFWGDDEWERNLEIRTSMKRAVRKPWRQKSRSRCRMYCTYISLLGEEDEKDAGLVE
jgi:hypothetical protein